MGSVTPEIDKLAAGEREKRFGGFEATGLASVLIVLTVVSSFSFLLFHSLVELFTVAVAWSVFVLAWNTRHVLGNPFLTLVGIAYLFIGGLDLLHTLSYKGIGVFPGYGADLPTQLWVAARFIEAGAILGGLLFSRRIKTGNGIFIGLAMVTVFLVVMIFTGLFPPCYVEGQGLTRFKLGSEYVICLLLIGAGWLVFRKRGEFVPSTFRYLLVAVACTVLSELAFTFYVSVYDNNNVAGHLFKLVSFYFMYKALVENSLNLPFSQLFISLSESEAARRDVDRILRHELKSPLVGIVGLPQVIAEEGGLSAKQKRLLGLIEDAGKNMKLQVEASLDIHHMEQGSFKYVPQPVDILSELADVRRQAEGKGIKPQVSVSLDGQQVAGDAVFPIWGHSGALRMTLGNVLLNAMEAERDGGRVHIDIFSGEKTTVSVWNPTPVPKSIRGRFFDKYVTEGKPSGTGLGTYAARLAARSLGGDMVLSSTDTEGTAVTITLPGKA